MKPETRTTRDSMLRGLVLAVLGVVVGSLFLEFVENVDWEAVGDALGRVTTAQLAVLSAVLVTRAVLNASPLSTFLGDLSLFRATVSDVSATLVSTFAPPPADTVLRVKVFSAWGIEPARGLAAATINVLVFYVNRLLVPIVGFVILLVSGWAEPAYLVIGLIALGAGVVLFRLAQAGVESPESARVTGVRAGELVQKVRRKVDPEAWGAKVLDFRNHVADRFAYTLSRSLVALFVMTVVDACLVLLALRFVGVSSSEVPILLVIGAFLVFYPLTIFPFGGLGILDSVLLGIFVASAGEAWEPEILAGLVVYRIVSIGGPMLLGAAALMLTARLRR